MALASARSPPIPPLEKFSARPGWVYEFPPRKILNLTLYCSSTWLENQSSQKWRRFGIDIETM